MRLRQAATLETLDAPSFVELTSAVEHLFALAEGDADGLEAAPSGPAAALEPELAEAVPDPNATSGEVAKLSSR
jgi:hypothetical protein